MAGQQRQHTIDFHANPTQRAFIESRAEADLFDCRKGEGKSAGLAWANYWHTKNNPGAESLMIRDTWENIRRTTLREFMQWFGQLGEWRAGDKEFIWQAERVPLIGRVTFIGLDAAEDASKVASMPLGAVYMDEPAPAAGESEGIDPFIFDTAVAQLRQPGLNWYAVKLAQNSPDESHWTYERFIDPGTAQLSHDLLPEQEPGFRCWRPATAENERNLPPGYYERLSSLWKDRPDLQRRFVQGVPGFQQLGRAVTPEWSDALHLASGLHPIPGLELHLLWDFGLNPTCIITQVTPLGHWLILESFVGEEIGAYELIGDVVKPRLSSHYGEWVRAPRGRIRGGRAIRHIGDPAGDTREQSSSLTSAVRVIRNELGGTWRPGPKEIEARTDPLRAALRRVAGGDPPRGVVQVDREGAREVWRSLRGGWHRTVHRTGIVGEIAKDIHSHPGDAMGYGAAILFPVRRLQDGRRRARPQSASYFHAMPGEGAGAGAGPLGFERPGMRVPRDARVIGR